MLDILKWFSIKVNKNFYKILFLYNGQEIEEDYYNSTFDSYASKLDRENSSMTIVACDLDDSGQVNINDWLENLEKNDSIKIKRFQSNEERDFYLKLELKYIYINLTKIKI